MSESLKLISPVDGSVYAERPVARDAEIEAALSSARGRAAEWKTVPVAERARYMLAFVDALLAMNDDVTVELAWQMGRPVRYGGEKGGVEERVRAMVAIAEEALGRITRRRRQASAATSRASRSASCMVIAPWNYPYLTAVNTIVPGLMAGNAVILKHAAQTLLVGERFAEAFRRAGLPEGLFHNLVLSHDADREADRLRRDRPRQLHRLGRRRPRDRARRGRHLRRARARARRQGPGLCARRRQSRPRGREPGRRRVLQFRPVLLRHRAHLCRMPTSTTISSRASPSSPANMCSAIRSTPRRRSGRWRAARFADTVREQIAEALRKGATALIDTKAWRAISAGSPYLAPQVLVDVDHQMEVMTEESFGPVVGIMKVRDDDEAITLMNDSPYGLTASIWTRDMDRAAERIGARVETGTVFMNRCDYLDPRSPGPASRTPAAARRCRDRLRRADPAEELSPERSLTASYPGQHMTSHQPRTGTIRPPSASAPGRIANWPMRAAPPASRGRCSSPIPASPSCR